MATMSAKEKTTRRRAADQIENEGHEAPVGRAFALGAVLIVGTTIAAHVFSPMAAPPAEQHLAVDWEAWGRGFVFAATSLGIAGCLLILRRRSLGRRQPFVRTAALSTAVIVGVWLPLDLLMRPQRSAEEGLGAALAGIVAGLLALCLLAGLLSKRVRHRGRGIEIAAGGVAILAVLIAGDDLPLGRSVIVNADSIGRLLIVTTSAALMIAGHKRGRWFPAFAGLSVVGYALAESLVGQAFGLLGTEQSFTFFAASTIALLSSGILFLGVTVELERDDLHHRRQILDAWTFARAGVEREARERVRHNEVLHDLRSGLLGIESVSPILATSPDRELVQLLQTEIGRLRDLTSGTNRVGYFGVKEALSPTLDLHARQGIGISLSGDAIVFADPGDVIEISQNLIDNARRHAPGSPISVEVNTYHEDVEIRISDRGPGIGETEAKQVFEAGYSTHRDGSGYGLSSSRGLAQANGGQLRYEPRLGGGATFRLRLPSRPRS